MVMIWVGFDIVRFVFGCMLVFGVFMVLCVVDDVVVDLVLLVLNSYG